GGMDRSNPTYHDIPQVEAIKSERGKDFTVLLFPNMNHDLLDVTTGRFDPQLFPRIIDWARTKLRAPGGIGAAGGTVSGAGATLVIPPGALSADTVITLSRRQNAPLDSSLDAGSLVEVSPADLRFDVPATLTLPFDPTRTPAGLPLQKLGVSRLDGEAWEAAAGSVGDAATNTATGKIGRGGTYGVRRNPAAAPCVAPQYRQFDFWLGSWDFTEPSSGPGQNLITRDAAGCVIEENFVSFTYRGHSVSFFEESTGKWYQTYVGNDGVRLVLEGTFVGGRMVLYQNPVSRYYWQTLDANRVRFALEASPNGGVTWQATPFNAIYSRR
ncbi:MAG: hypothetical protein JNK60_23065, partial [Acidobacteria bacterium]|nr:hypothetical protein [Acidobacteriota bacterium]